MIRLLAEDFLGAKALLFMYIWLLSSIAAAYISERKGFSDRAGLATGMCLSIVGPSVWLVIPAKSDSKWKTVGPWGGKERRVVDTPSD
jgi:hypothetical protein